MAGKVTDLRRDLLQSVADGEIFYQATTATWFRGGETLAGWEGRSLRSMRHAPEAEQLISTPVTSTPNAKVVVELTDQGRAALSKAGGAPGPE